MVADIVHATPLTSADFILLPNWRKSKFQSKLMMIFCYVRMNGNDIPNINITNS